MFFLVLYHIPSSFHVEKDGIKPKWWQYVLLVHSRSQNACINAKDVCWIVNPAGIIFTLTARRKTFHFPCFTHTEILMDTFVVGWSKESNSKER